MAKLFHYLTILPTDSLGGGAEQLLYNVFEYHTTNNKICKIIFLSKKKSGRWETLKNKAEITYLPFNNVYLGYLFIIPILLKINLTTTVEKTFTSQTLINSLLGLLKRVGFFKKTKVIARESNSIFHLLSGKKLRMYKNAYKIGYPGVDLVICQTSYMKAELIKGMPWMQDKLKIIVLNNPINIDLIKKNAKKVLTTKLPEKFLVAAGRLAPVKGFDILIPAFKRLLRDFPQLKLLILGEGNERKRLERIISSESLQDKVILIGFVNNVYPYFRDAEMCVMSSRIEGFPNVLLQMMSQNQKVVTTLSAGDIEKIDGLYTCETNNISALAATMRNCLSADLKENRLKFDLNLNKRTIENFVDSILLEL
ncbi:glycosyltransferase [Maribacter sp. MJ134]|uniref:glycosyltransferase n=1 Tax=Maribacter sp. MJ134 TaxID=2496865 RepID=UPI000F84D39A|nr:glycosyltransferase [Maribacter sp. MJ134]AZQ58476.1 glycosyltransferase [Maribacter sp. MJ134]